MTAALQGSKSITDSSSPEFEPTLREVACAHDIHETHELHSPICGGTTDCSDLENAVPQVVITGTITVPKKRSGPGVRGV